ncbi:MAG TPA: serine/threonine-protein kinase [Polyangiaceae bacterium]
MTDSAPRLEWTIPRSGDVIGGKYVVERACGRGGLAVVLSAMHAGLDQRVAIKMLLPEWAGDTDVVERFLREGRAATRIKSEHVVRVFDVGTHETGAPYLVLEFLEGHNLDDVLRMWGPLPVPTAVDWVLQAAEAIAEAHAYGIVHRDLKPANLFLTRRADGSACVKVIDFGLSKITDPRMSGSGAKLTRPSDVMGSPHYMAPEQLRATCEADTRADLWALGAVLHELLVGKPPFRGDTVPEICATVLTQDPPKLTTLRASVPPPLENAVLRCLEKDPDVRLANAAELARAIAPYGTSVARTSCARIERLIEGGGAGGVVSDLSLLPPMDERPPSLSDWPSGAHDPPLRGSSSARMVLGSMLVLGAVGVAALMGMYSLVHGDEPHAGVTDMQPVPRATIVPTATATAAAPGTATATATATVAAPATATESEQATAPTAVTGRGGAKGAAVTPVQGPRSPAVPAAKPAPKWAPKPHAVPSPTPAAPAPPSGDDLFDGRK